MDLGEKNVAVLGLGASGVAAAALCLRRGARVTCADERPGAALGAEARKLEDAGATLLLGSPLDAMATPLTSFDLIVVSPGVPPFPALELAAAEGTPVVSEIELSFRELDGGAKVLAIGGTNGKSTTTALVHALLEAHGLRTFVGGNFGEPLASHVDESWDAVVLEVSSFQLERIDEFHPVVAVLLNVTPDHLDCYEDFDAYAAAKGNVFTRQTADDIAVIPNDDDVCAKEARRGYAQFVTFGSGEDADIVVSPDAVSVRATGDVYLRREMALTGGHNALNVAAALAAIAPFAVPPATIRPVLASFAGLPHRTALVATVAGVRYYDDSKGTNVGASVTALLGLVEPKAVLIAGGRDKGGSYEPLVVALKDKGRGLVVMGEAAEAIEEAARAGLGGAVPIAGATSMETAVITAAAMAKPGDAVLLSPACSSFDMFRDYKHRGDAFVDAVRSLERLLGKEGPR